MSVGVRVSGLELSGHTVAMAYHVGRKKTADVPALWDGGDL